MTPTTWLGIDIGGTTIKWEHLSDGGQALASGRVATPTTGHLAVTDALADIIEGAGTRASRPTGVGIAVPGHLSPARDSITLLPNVNGDWVGFPINSSLQARTGFTPTLLNDARAFAVAELELGAARSCSEAVFVTIGTGIGGALAIDGRVVRSRGDRTGELGHTTVVVDGELCSCGHRGCVEAYAGGAQILRRARQHGFTIDAPSGALAALGLAAGASVSSGTALSGILADAYDALAVGVSNACAFSGAQVVVIGGGVADELPGFLDRTRYRLAGRRALLGDVDVRKALVGVRAGAVGAALTARTESFTSSHTTEPRTMEHSA